MKRGEENERESEQCYVEANTKDKHKLNMTTHECEHEHMNTICQGERHNKSEDEGGCEQASGSENGCKIANSQNNKREHKSKTLKTEHGRRSEMTTASTSASDKDNKIKGKRERGSARASGSGNWCGNELKKLTQNWK